MKTYKVVVSTLASRDLASILEYVAGHHGLDAALSVDGLLDEALRSLDSLPDRGHRVAALEQHGITSYREIVAAPYRIVYRITGREVWVLAIVDGRRDLDELLYERARR